MPFEKKQNWKKNDNVILAITCQQMLETPMFFVKFHKEKRTKNLRVCVQAYGSSVKTIIVSYSANW